MKYRRCFLPGGTFFFTVVTYNRNIIFHNPETVTLLRDAFQYVLDRHPFQIDACVILPDHIHTIWTLPENDSDYAMRWRLLKSHFTSRFELKQSALSASRKIKKEQAVWQRRYWEHLIRDEEDLMRHVEYIHYNPVKHGLTDATFHWPYSSFHQYVRNGLYPSDWAMTERCEIAVAE